MRLRNNPNALNELENSKYIINSFPTKIDEKTIIELGMGKGEMITELAYKNPNKKYIGIEKYATVAHKAMKRAEKLKLENFNIICDDIVNLPSLLKGKANIIWLTFSDPWPKNRHEKRRLTHSIFLDIYKKILSKNGVIKLKTDNDKLFEWTLEHMKEYGMILNNITRNFHLDKTSKNNIMTGYELKWSLVGKKINYLEAKF